MILYKNTIYYDLEDLANILGEPRYVLERKAGAFRIYGLSINRRNYYTKEQVEEFRRAWNYKTPQDPIDYEQLSPERESISADTPRDQETLDRFLPILQDLRALLDTLRRLEDGLAENSMASEKKLEYISALGSLQQSAGDMIYTIQDLVTKAGA